MSKRRRKKTVLDLRAPTVKKEATEEQQPKIKQVPMPGTPTFKKQIETTLLEAPMLGWNFDIAYIDNEFRKSYVALLQKLVKLYDLPYNVNQTAVLAPK